MSVLLWILSGIGAYIIVGTVVTIIAMRANLEDFDFYMNDPKEVLLGVLWWPLIFFMMLGKFLIIPFLYIGKFIIWAGTPRQARKDPDDYLDGPTGYEAYDEDFINNHTHNYHGYEDLPDDLTWR